MIGVNSKVVMKRSEMVCKNYLCFQSKSHGPDCCRREPREREIMNSDTHWCALGWWRQEGSETVAELDVFWGQWAREKE